MKKPTRSKRVPPQSKRVPPQSIENHFGGNSHLHLTVKPDQILAPPPLIVETVYFSRIGHTFKKFVPPFGPTMYAVQDFLLDQTGTSGADGKMSATKSFDLTTAVSYRFNVLPKDRTKRIRVKLPTSGPAFFGLDVGRRFVNAVSDYLDQYQSNSFFINLVGPTPIFTYNAFSIGHNTNHWIKFMLMADVFDPIVFSGFTTYGIYPPRSFDPGLKSYIPYSNSLPFNLPGPNSVPYLMFSYATEDPVDPGPFVSIS